jgi:hypothetical protein
MQKLYCPVAYRCMRMQAPSNHSQIHHLCTCNSEPRVLVQGAEVDETLPPSADTFSQSAKTDKTVQLSDKHGPPSPKAPRTRRALSQPAQRRTPKPLELVSTSASQPEVFKRMVGVHLCAVPDSLFRGLPLAQAPRVYNVNGAPRQTSKDPQKNKVGYPSLAVFFNFSDLEYLDFA